MWAVLAADMDLERSCGVRSRRWAPGMVREDSEERREVEEAVVEEAVVEEAVVVVVATAEEEEGSEVEVSTKVEEAGDVPGWWTAAVSSWSGYGREGSAGRAAGVGEGSGEIGRGGREEGETYRMRVSRGALPGSRRCRWGWGAL